MLQPWLTLRIDRKRREADDIYSFDLVAPGGEALPPFEAGAHIDVRVGDGLVRQYSLCNTPADQHRYRIAVLHAAESSGGSRALAERFHEGDTVEAGVPRNLFPLAGPGGHSLLFAGGIGITPILCMAERLASAGRPFSLHYAGRTRSRLAFLDRILSPPLDTSARIYLDDEPDQPRLQLPELLANPAPDAHLYVCGPAGFMEAVLAVAGHAGWPAGQLHREYFTAPVDPGAAAAATFEVKVASTGQVYRVPADRSVADVLAEHGVEVALSCEQGVCGSCLTGVLSGKPDHRDQVLTEAEHAANTQFTPCCSRSCTPLLVLDL